MSMVFYHWESRSSENACVLGPAFRRGGEGGLLNRRDALDLMHGRSRMTIDSGSRGGGGVGRTKKHYTQHALNHLRVAINWSFCFSFGGKFTETRKKCDESYFIAWYQVS